MTKAYFNKMKFKNFKCLLLSAEIDEIFELKYNCCRILWSHFKVI